MAEKRKNSDQKHISLDDLLKYRSGELTEREKHAIEKRLLEDDFEREAMEGFESQESSDLSKDIASLNKQINERTASKKSNNLYWRMAASLLFLISASFVIYFLLQTDLLEPEMVSQEPTKQRPDSSMIAQELDLPFEEAPEIPISPKEENRSVEKPDKKKDLEEAPSPITINEEEVTEEIAADLNVENSDNEVIGETVMEESVTLPAHVEMATKDSRADRSDEVRDIELDPSGAASQEEQIARVKTSRGKKAAEREQEHARVAVMPAVVEPAAANASGLSVATFNGLVRSEEDGAPLPGINVIVKGTNTGTTTNMDGRFSLQLEETRDPVLVISGVGYLSREISAKDMDLREIQLSEDNSSLSEIVVVGYGVKKELESQHIPPRPVGGHKVFKDYIHDHLQYPQMKKPKAVKENVRMKVLITEAGKIGKINVLKSPGKAFEKEAIRLIEDGPEWEPARENGSPVAEEVIIRIRFNPSEE